MPSPVGHTLGAFAAGWLVAGPGAAAPAGPGSRGEAWRHDLAFVLVGTMPDLDLLLDRHSQVTHSLGAAVLVLVIAALWLRRRRHGLRLALALAAAYASHLLIDWLAQDATPPRGIMALWPLSHAYYLSHADIFWGISRHPWADGAMWHDAMAVVLEMAILGTVAALAWWSRRPAGVQVWPRLDGGSAQQLPPASPPAGHGESHGDR